MGTPKLQTNQTGVGKWGEVHHRYWSWQWGQSWGRSSQPVESALSQGVFS